MRCVIPVQGESVLRRALRRIIEYCDVSAKYHRSRGAAVDLKEQKNISDFLARPTIRGGIKRR